MYLSDSFSLELPKDCKCHPSKIPYIQFYLFQPFTSHPKQTNLFLGIAFIWAISLLIAVGPLLESNGHRFYHTALMKQNLFFDSWEVDFNAFKSFAIKLLQFYPGMRNMTDYEIKTVVNAESWTVLTQFVKTRYSTNVQPTDYYGWVIIPIRDFLTENLVQYKY